MHTATTTTTASFPAPPAVDPRYADLADARLAVTLTAEDAAEQDWLDPLERTTCHTHRRWLHSCVSSPLHVIIVTGHRWCRRCSCAVSVAIDELTGDVRLTCPRCQEMPAGAANRQVVRCCRASLAAAAESTDSWTVRSLPRRAA
ncbi:MAG TPA: hypothetical protein VNP92_16120 [Actinophytocola sp.]|nr:hypothetical protein [Actinophytocola sp.]